MSKYIFSSTHGKDYLLFRPNPPSEMVTRIMNYLREQIREPFNLALDVGCGSGQGTAQLAPHFKAVLAVDTDPVQIDNAKSAHKNLTNVSFSIGGAEKLDCADNSVDLVSAVQSAHWFRLDKFYKEVDRVLVPGGVLAMSGYRLPIIAALNGTVLTEKVHQLFSGKLGEYVPEGSRMVYLDNYRSGRFKTEPFSNGTFIREDFLTMPKEGSLDDLIGYIKTWSTYGSYVKKHGETNANRVIAHFASQLKSAMGQGEQSGDLEITFSYFLLLSRKAPARGP